MTLHATPPVTSTEEGLACKHCGEACGGDVVMYQDHPFCCAGCQMVYEILEQNDMCRYYEIDPKAGFSLRGRTLGQYAFLDETDVRERLVDFTDGNRTRVTFRLPAIHCASCIWLLENLYKLSPGILASRVNFLKKEVYLTFEEGTTTLRQAVELLASIGYAPDIHLGSLDKQAPTSVGNAFSYKLGLAGFAFGNIMLLSFPEYLGLDKVMDARFSQWFGILNILLAVPVVTYSGREFLTSAWHGLRNRYLNIDVPIALGIMTLLGRSLYEILSHTGAGYLDSLAGLIFFLLAGKWFQRRTYHHISFERDYRSYFPIASNRLENGVEHPVTLDKLRTGDMLVIRNEELVPADSILQKGLARIDYSFVTGESAPVRVEVGEKVYAGGRQMGEAIEVTMVREVSQSYLTELWNDEAFSKKKKTPGVRLSDKTGSRFTAAILTVAAVTLVFWLPREMSTAINAFTAVLIIACPCAIALAVPFTLGNAIRLLGQKGMYIKNTDIIEVLAGITAVVFDKTGTLTRQAESEVAFVGGTLSTSQKDALMALAAQSNHPVSRAISGYWKSIGSLPSVEAFAEHTGQGTEALISGHLLRLGSASLIGAPEDKQAAAWVQIDEAVIGYFTLQNKYREGMEEVVRHAAARGEAWLLSGDTPAERSRLEHLFAEGANLKFRQSPQDKLHFIQSLQDNGHQVLMLGDGLNDAGALRQSDAGIVLTEDSNNFSPACDGILHAGRFARLPNILQYARESVRLVYAAYTLALIYNVIGLFFAVQGLLSPVIAAILMPASSVTIALFGVLSSTILAHRRL